LRLTEQHHAQGNRHLRHLEPRGGQRFLERAPELAPLKVSAGKTALQAAIDALPDESPLFHLLRDDRIHPDDALPATGVPLEWERLLSAAFVRSSDYGTRSSTVLTRYGGGRGTLDEQAWAPDGTARSRRRYRFALSAHSS